MQAPSRYPGTRQQQAALQAVAEHYARDPRILAVCVFGSLGRGNWDRYSDLDLDVVIAEGVTFAIGEELRGLCDALGAAGERAALVIPTGEDEGDVVTESLLELSVRYHTLRTTSPAIVDTLLVLTGRLDTATIQAAGLANRQDAVQPLDRLVDKGVRYAVEVGVALQRQRVWMAIELLHRMRGLMMELYAQSHGGLRPLQFFEANADPALQADLAATLPSSDPSSLRVALTRFLALLENDLERWTDGRVHLTAGQREVVQNLKVSETFRFSLPNRNPPA